VDFLPSVIRDDNSGFEDAIAGGVETCHFKIQPEKTRLFVLSLSHREAGKDGGASMSMKKPELNPSEDKQKIRQMMRERRRALPEWEIQERSRKICAWIRESKEWSRARNVGVYLAFDGEVDLRSLIQSAWRTHRVAAPRLGEGGRMSWHVLRSWKDLEKRERGYEEPREGLPLVTFEERDIVLVPGVAFDFQGNRLGFGLGCYDRFLKKCPAFSMGVAYHFQVVEMLPVEPHDVVLNSVVTENGMNFLV
jgi:5-formyltetrahydrofolate cyclo-ligase